MDGVGGVADGGAGLPPKVCQGEVAALSAEDLWDGADVGLAVVAAVGRAGPELVAAAEGLVRWQKAGDRLGDAAAGGAPVAGRARHLVEHFGVAQVNAGVGPIQPADPRQRLTRRGRQTFLLVLPGAVRVAEDRGGVVQGAGELQVVQAAKADAEAQLRRLSQPPARMLGRDELAEMTRALGDMVRVPADADPARKARIYAGLGLRLTYHPYR